jgi:hypothetical protein
MWGKAGNVRIVFGDIVSVQTFLLWGELKKSGKQRRSQREEREVINIRQSRAELPAPPRCTTDKVWCVTLQVTDVTDWRT